MKWQSGRSGSNIEDRRGMSRGGKMAIGGIGGIVVLLIGFFLGGDPTALLEQLNEGGGAIGNTQEEYVSTPEEDRLMDFADKVLASIDDVWSELYRQHGQTYKTPKMVIYNGGTETSGCGMGLSEYGPFYCPADQSIYLDLSFNRELSEKFGAKGEFALAYVIAHEVGHHIQNLTGVLNKTASLRQSLSEKEYNKISVMTELQADYYAGVWAHHVNAMTNIEIDYQDIIDGMKAAEAVGDDRIQESARGYSQPETFTHGTSEQRMYWFKKGYDSGKIEEGNTFEEMKL